MVSVISDSQNMAYSDEEAAGGGWTSPSLGIYARLLFVQCLPPSTSSLPIPLLAQPELFGTHHIIDIEDHRFIGHC